MGVKTVLIVIGVAVGLFVLYKLLSQSIKQFLIVVFITLFLFYLAWRFLENNFPIGE